MPSNTSQTNNGSPLSPAASVKKGKKSPAKAKAPAAPKVKAAPAVDVNPSQPVEILFTQEPNPYQQPVAPYIWIDHPQNNERLLASEYVIRLGVGGADLVQLSIDKGPWQNCRLTSGYWWFDWSAIVPGKHTLVARMRTADGRWLRTPNRTCDLRP